MIDSFRVGMTIGALFLTESRIAIHSALRWHLNICAGDVRGIDTQIQLKAAVML